LESIQRLLETEELEGSEQSPIAAERARIVERAETAVE
jgi:hypothetical protein